MYLVGLILFWIMLAFVCSAVAEYKNRNTMAWFWLGFFFGIFALIVVAVLPKIEVYEPYSGNTPQYHILIQPQNPPYYYQYPPQQTYSNYQPRLQLEAGTSSCPGCGTKVENNFNLCPYCGTCLVSKCGNCGREIKPEWNICPQCGNAIHADSSQ